MAMFTCVVSATPLETRSSHRLVGARRGAADDSVISRDLHSGMGVLVSAAAAAATVGNPRRPRSDFAHQKATRIDSHTRCSVAPTVGGDQRGC